MEWKGYDFKVDLENGTSQSGFKWDEGHDPMLSVLGSLNFMNTMVWVLFDNPILNGQSFAVELRLGDYTSGTAIVSGIPKPIPEPSTMLLLGSGLVGLIGYQMRKQA